jgi:hypothetical protein
MTSERIYRIVGIWDLILTLPFALPIVNVQAVFLLSWLNGILSPDVIFPAFDGLHMFFVQLFGILAVLWAVVRIHKPSAYLAFYDMVGRFVVAAVMLSTAVMGISLVPAVFAVSEIGFGIVQAVVLGKKR